jgi:hypothetical protein
MSVCIYRPYISSAIYAIYSLHIIFPDFVTTITDHCSIVSGFPYRLRGCGFFRVKTGSRSHQASPLVGTVDLGPISVPSTWVVWWTKWHKQIVHRVLYLPLSVSFHRGSMSIDLSKTLNHFRNLHI